MSHVHLKRMYILLLLDEIFYIYFLKPFSLKCHWRLVIFSLNDIRGVLKVPYYCVTANFSLYVCYHLFYIFMCLMLGADIFIIISACWINPWSLPFLSLFTAFKVYFVWNLALFSTFAWNILFCPFSFSLHVSLNLK